MTERYRPYPPDEPVIGGSYPPAALASRYTEGQGYSGASIGPADDPGEEWDDEYGDEYEDEYGEYDRYDDGDTPVRQPLFYVFIGLAAIVGGIMVFLLFSLMNNGDGGDAGPASASASVKFNVRIDSPTKDKRIEIGRPEEVIVQATSTEPIVRFDLYVQDRLADTLDITQASPDNKYRATLKATFERKGEYTLYVKVTSASNATDESDKLRIIAIEPVGDRPQSINGKVVATVNLRTGPGENFEQVGTLTEGKIVKIVGRTSNNEWVLVEVDGGRWVKTSALELQDSLALVPIRQVTPTPVPATSTPLPSPSASPSPSVSPTVNAKSPDLAPTGAVLIDGGSKLRVTVANLSQNAYTGALEVAVANVVSGTLRLAFNVNIPAGGTTTLDFELNPAVTTQKTAQVKVDPDNAVKETNKDNNTQSFGLTPAVEAPKITIQSPSVAPSAITVTFINTGGPLASSMVTVRITLGDETIAVSKMLALAPGQESPSFQVTRPKGNGEAKIEVLVGDVVLATTTVRLTP